jgi:isoleucyl-tRNA synthetase
MDRFADLDEYDPAAVEDRAAAHWEAVDAYERAKDSSANGESFFFVDGPPYTSGGAHMGTTWNKALKDAIIRHYRMRGYDITDRPGYDMHGLPIETKVEEELGFDNKQDIEEYGEEAFIEACKEFAEDNLDRLQSDFQSFGVWMDWENPYRTVEPSYMEAAWWAFSEVHDRGLVETGQRSINQCPRCETAIANNEVEYHQVGKPSVYARFPLADREGSLVVWTTTPWTFVANTFVAVDADGTYAKVRATATETDLTGSEERAETLYIAANRVEEVLRAGRFDDYEIVDELPGEALVGWTYEHPLRDAVPDAPSSEGACQVYAADYVDTADEGTGLVHSAPGHGEEDFERGTELGLEVFCPVGADGVYTDAAGKYAGQFVRDANDDIVADLDEAGLLLASESGHSVREGQCWRCDTDIVRIVTDQWFITVTDVKEDLLANIADSEWYPDWARDNRFRDFVEEAPDWNVSRQRYWGIPIPIWTPEGVPPEAVGDDLIVIGTREELAERVDQPIDPEAVDLHKPTVDDLTITADGTTYTRVPDVFDVWLDSSVATWGTLDYPEETADFEELWPADLIVEAHDQTRGWFWSQLGMGTAAADRVPYERVLMHGHALDEDGRKMSKSVGNVIEPDEVIDRHGADPMRVFLLSVSPQGEDMRFAWDEVQNAARDLGILWNVFRFPLPYMDLDDVDPAELDVANAELETVDRWILSRLQTTTEEMTERWDAYEPDEALAALREFVVEDCSRYYVQSVRDRVWAEEDDPSKRAVYATLAHVMERVARLLAPYAPHVSEAVYQEITGSGGRETVHATDWPTVDAGLHDPELEGEIQHLRAVEAAGGHARQRADRNRRWPVRRIVVDVAAAEALASGDDAAAGDADDPVEPADIVAAVETHRDLLAERLNAREIELVGPDEDWADLQYRASADMSALGPAFGDDAHDVMTACNEARLDAPDLDALAAAVEAAVGIDAALEPAMVEFEPVAPDGVAGAEFDGGRVYVDATLDEDVESEGYAREVIRRVQELRKDLDLDVEERIVVDLSIDDDRVADLVERHADLIREEVRADRLGTVDGGTAYEDEVEGVEITVRIAPVSGATV